MTNETGAMLGYTLAIPKGDAHDWSSRIVGFFGRLFRTVGEPIRGIEENIPLEWHQQVNVQRLDVTGSCTVYNKADYSRRVIPNVYIFDDRGDVPEVGIGAVKGTLNVTIYADRGRTETYIPRIGDIIAVGVCEFEFDTTSQLTMSESMRSFRESGTVFGVIGEITTVKYGELPDYIIKAR